MFSRSFLRRGLLGVVALAASTAVSAQTNPLDGGRTPIVNPLDAGGAAQLGPNGGAVGPIVGGQQPGERAPEQAALPAFFKPGTRIMFYQSESTTHNVPWHLVPNAFGNGMDWKQNNNSGTVSYLAIDMVAASPKLIAGNATKFMASAAGGALVSSGANAVLGNANNFDQFWVHPARLAQIAQGREPGFQANRVQYRTENKVYNALAVMQFSERNYASQVYDLETGLLLSATTADRGAGVAVPAGPGKVGAAAGAIQSHNYRFVGIRERNIPWADMPAPEAFAQQRQFQFTGGYNAVTQFGPAGKGFGQSRLIATTPIASGVALADGRNQSENGTGVPNTSSDRQVFSSASVLGLWLPVGAANKLRPGQVIDEDPVVRNRVTFVGVRNNAAMFVAEGPAERGEVAYDLQTGLQVWSRSTLTLPGVGGSQIAEMRLAGQR